MDILGLCNKDITQLRLRKLLHPVALLHDIPILIRFKTGFEKIHILDIPLTWKHLHSLKHTREFIIEVRHPGIGDHLFYSHLPELLIKYKLADHVYISKHSSYRFEEILKLVWFDNPYIAGIHEKHGWHNSGLRQAGANFLDGIVYQFTGRTPKPGSTSPILYNAERFKDTSGIPYGLIDLNRIANRHSVHSSRIASYLDSLEGSKDLEYIFAYENILFEEVLKASKMLQIRARNGRLQILRPEPTLALYFKRICNASHFFGMYSGGALIAAAYHVPTTTFCEKKDPATSFLHHTYVTQQNGRHSMPI